MSSSGHVEAARILFGLEGDEVGLHAGSLAALVLGCHREAFEILGRLSLRRVGMHVLAGAIPAALGYAKEMSDMPTGSSRRLAAGMLAGAALLLSLIHI